MYTSIIVKDTQEAGTISIGKIYGFNVDRDTKLLKEIIQEEVDNAFWEELVFELLTTEEYMQKLPQVETPVDIQRAHNSQRQKKQ